MHVGHCASKSVKKKVEDLLKILCDVAKTDYHPIGQIGASFFF